MIQTASLPGSAPPATTGTKSRISEERGLPATEISPQSRFVRLARFFHARDDFLADVATLGVIDRVCLEVGSRGMMSGANSRAQRGTPCSIRQRSAAASSQEFTATLEKAARAVAFLCGQKQVPSAHAEAFRAAPIARRLGAVGALSPVA